MSHRTRIRLLGLIPVLVIVAVIAARLIGGGPQEGTVQADAPPGPVILVAGYGGSTSSLNRLAAHLRTGGREVVVQPPVGDNTGDLHVQATALAATARGLVAAGASSVDVVGYSAGGVVARIWVEDEGRTLARRVVTLGSPHHGTTLAGLAVVLASSSCPTACRQLAPDSDLLDNLPDAAEQPRWTSIWTDQDDVVRPPDSAVLKGALDIQLQEICPDDRTRHSGLPDDPLAAGLVVRALTGTGLTAVPGPAECSDLRAAGR